MLLGWAVGLIVRYVRGTPTTDPSGLDVAQALEGSGFLLTVLRASALTRGGRRYSATTRAASDLTCWCWTATWRVTGCCPSPGAASGFARTTAVAVSPCVGASNGVTGGVRRPGRGGTITTTARGEPGRPRRFAAGVPRTIDAEPFANVADDLNDGDLDRAWIAVRKLQDANISHRTLSANNILRDANGGVWLVNGQEGSVAAR